MTSPDSHDGAEQLAATVAEQVSGLDPVWKTAIAEVHRHWFLPERIWADDTAVDKGSKPHAWWKAAYADQPVVTSVDGAPGRETWPTTSASQPSVVARMLQFLDPRQGGPFLEIGTGTGWNAALLAFATGDKVVSIEIDPEAADAARGACEAAGVTVRVVTGDGSAGVPEHGPYGSVIATCAAYGVPSAWVKQTRPGGRLVIPWASPWVAYGTAVLTKKPDGGAEGRFAPLGAFMPLRTTEHSYEALPETVETTVVRETTTELAPWLLKSGESDAAFALGAMLPGYGYLTAEARDPEPGEWCCGVRVIDPTGENWADVDHRHGRDDGPFIVTIHGEHDVWAEVEKAHAWWVAEGRPSPGQFGLTIDTEGTQRIWYGDPSGPSWGVPSP